MFCAAEGCLDSNLVSGGLTCQPAATWHLYHSPGGRIHRVQSYHRVWRFLYQIPSAVHVPRQLRAHRRFRAADHYSSGVAVDLLIGLEILIGVGGGSGIQKAYLVAQAVLAI